MTASFAPCHASPNDARHYYRQLVQGSLVSDVFQEGLDVRYHGSMTTRLISCICACALTLSLGCGGPAKAPESAALENVSQATGPDRAPDLNSGWAKAGKTELAKRAFSLFDARTNMVVGVDLAAIVSSEPYELYRRPIEAAIDQSDDFANLRKLRETCGFDPLAEIEQIVAGAFMDPYGEVKTGPVVVVIRGMARSQFVQCSEKATARDGGEVLEQGEFTLVTDSAGKESWVLWLDSDTMVLADKLSREDINARRAQRGVDGHPDMYAILEQVPQDSAMWIAMRPDSGIQIPEGGIGFSKPFTLTAMSGWLKVANGLDIHATMRLNNDQLAGQLYEELGVKLREARPMADMMGLGAVMDKLELSTSLVDVSLTLTLDMKDIKLISDMAGM